MSVTVGNSTSIGCQGFLTVIFVTVEPTAIVRIPSFFCLLSFGKHSPLPLGVIWRLLKIFGGAAEASWEVRSPPDRAVRVRALIGDIVLCSWALHLTLAVPVSTQVYKRIVAKLILRVTPAMHWHPLQGGVEILLFS